MQQCPLPRAWGASRNGAGGIRKLKASPFSASAVSDRPSTALPRRLCRGAVPPGSRCRGARSSPPAGRRRRRAPAPAGRPAGCGGASSSRRRAAASAAPGAATGRGAAPGAGTPPAGTFPAAPGRRRCAPRATARPPRAAGPPGRPPAPPAPAAGPRGSAWASSLVSPWPASPWPVSPWPGSLWPLASPCRSRIGRTGHGQGITPKRRRTKSRASYGPIPGLPTLVRGGMPPM